MNDFDSIENLISPQIGDEDNTSSLFARKQEEIKKREIEKQAKANASQAGLAYVDLSRFPISHEAISLIPEKTARDLKIVCFFYDGKNIRLGCLKASEEANQLLNNLSSQYFCEGRLYLISETSLKTALEAYNNIPKNKHYDSGVEISEASLAKFQQAISSYKNLSQKINEVNISDLVTLILATAIKVGGSDVHVETEENGVVIRIRIDGVLQEAATIDKEKWDKIISRLKILSRVKINITDKPQDGRYTIFLKEKNIDVRCSFLPTAYGESVVMRLLDSSAASLEFDKLGIRPEILSKLQKEIIKPNGLILTTGPTGSGKTTTLYAVLNQLNRPGTKIITLEDPIEYQLKGINQSQVDNSRGYTFSDGLRSILRQDPNIVMVGEIRDLETAEIAVQASLTGHLVLSTLHTNDAAGVIPRLIDIGVKSYFLAPSINAVIGQRLVRHLCPHCRKKKILNDEEREKIGRVLAVISPKAGIDVPSELPEIYQAGDGCENCNFTGYKGRVGIYEIFTMNDAIKQLTVDNAPSFKMLQQAVEDGMITMLQDGILKVLEGQTSLDEVYRVIGNFDYINELYDIVISQTIGRGVKIKEENFSLAEQVGQDLKNIDSHLKDVPTGELIEIVSALGAISQAGDIHIEPAENTVDIRFRIDGVMHDIMKLPKTSYLPLLSEMKILAGASTNVKMATFDGRFSIYLPSNRGKIDCRLSIITGGYGETVVIRLLSSSAANLEMSKLGITENSLVPLQAAMKKTRGLIITTGPTGSGKTTTLYSILNQLNRPDIKIITVEDPIEYQLPGIMQTQIDEAHGYTFASAMRSLLRQNPNIMMIGEIRDEETAKIAVEASMTGHLVLSTIHANSAAGAISRLAGLGLERQLLAASLEFVIGQRLVRRLCPYCRKEYTPSPEELKQAMEIIQSIKNPLIKLPEKPIFFRSDGCDKCNQLGYKGRIGIYETIKISPAIQKAMQESGITDAEIENLAINEGTVTMIQDGIIKALTGETSLEEIMKAIQ